MRRTKDSTDASISDNNISKSALINAATIADKVYMEPLTLEYIAKIILLGLS